MAATLQFVDKVDASPTTLLDLNSGIWSVQLNGTDFGFPDLNRAVVSTLLRDGGSSPASAHGLRTLTLRLLTDTTNADAVATAKQSLFRQLNEPTNLLKFQPNTTAPVFFRTLRSEATSVEVIGEGKTQYTVVNVLAEPYAVGLKVTSSSLTVTNDPAAANKPWVDLTGVTGDVPTPAVIKVQSGTSLASKTSVTAVRRHGTPSNATFFMQCESLTLGTDTTLPGNDAAMSGAGSNYARVSFATNANAVDRLSGNFPSAGAQSIDQRGQYRVFVRCRASTSTSSTFTIQMGWGQTTALYSQTTRTVSTSATTARLIDLGLFGFPIGNDPIVDGYTNTELTMEPVHIRVKAARTAGTASLDLDYLIFVPADEELAMVSWSADTNLGVLDGVNDEAWSRDASNVVQTGQPNTVQSPGFPMLTPNQTNRIFFLTGAEGNADRKSVV